MSRDTSDLWSGVNSQSTRTVRAKREIASIAKEKERVALEPYQEIVMGILDKRLAESKDITTLKHEFDTKEETMQALVAARSMNIEFIESVTAEIVNKLRDSQPKARRRRRSDE